MVLTINSVLNDTRSEENDIRKYERILYMDDKNNLAVTIYIHDKQFRTKTKRISDLESFIRNGAAVILESEPFIRELDETGRSKLHLQRRDFCLVHS